VLYHGHNNNMAVRRRLLEDMGGFIERPRGADTILVRRTVDRFGCDAVGHDPGMRVHHLEIDSVAVYLRKLALYARTRRACQGIVQQRGLTNRERWHVYRRTVCRLGCSALQSVCLLALLTCGLAYCTVMSLLPMDDK
jgi:hypothetical protein